MPDIPNNTMDIPILSIIVYLPVVTALILLFLKDKVTIQRVAMIGALITFVLSIVALVFYLTTSASGAKGVDSFELQEYFVWLSTGDFGAGVATGLFPILVLWYLNRDPVKRAFGQEEA